MPAVQGAYVVSGYNDDSRQNPTMRWLEAYTKVFDSGLQTILAQLDKWTTPDYTLVKPDGSVHEGREAGFAALSSIYGPFTQYNHVPTFGIVYDTDEGYEIVGIADLYYSLVGEGPSAGVKNPEGKSFDGVLPGAFRFVIAKSSDGEGGLMHKKTYIMSDSGPVVVQLLQRGVIKPADVGL